MSKIKALLMKAAEQCLQEYGLVIMCIVIGILIGWYIKYITVDKRYIKQVELRLSDKEDQINSLKRIVYDRLSNNKPEEIPPGFFKKVRGFFKATVSIAKVKVSKK